MSVPSNSLARKPIDIEKETQIARDTLLAARLQRELQQEDIDAKAAIESVKRLEEINNDTAARAASMMEDPEQPLQPWSSWQRALVEPVTTTSNNNSSSSNSECKDMNDLIQLGNNLQSIGNKLELENLRPEIQKEEVTSIKIITKKDYKDLLDKSFQVDELKEIIEGLKKLLLKEYEETRKLRKACDGLRKLNGVLRLTSVNESKKDQTIIKENEKLVEFPQKEKSPKSAQEKHLPS